VHRELASDQSCPVGFKNGIDDTISAAHVKEGKDSLPRAGLTAQVMIDFSHAKSSKQFKKHLDVNADVCGQIASSEKAIIGVMIGKPSGERQPEFGKWRTFGLRQKRDR